MLEKTLVRNLSAYWLNIDFRVAVVDADPQGSIINRYNPKGILEKLYVIANPEETVESTIEENDKVIINISSRTSTFLYDYISSNFMQEIDSLNLTCRDLDDCIYDENSRYYRA